MSCTTAVMLKDRLNDIERNIYDGIDFRQELNEAYALADELQDENAKLRSMRDTWQENDANLREQNSELRKLVADLWTHCPADRYYCALCEYGNDDGSECKLADRMSELGIEVG